MNRLDENHSFNINVCIALNGHIQKAIILKEIYGWCHINKSKNHNLKRGLFWTFMTSKAFTEKFPYMKQKSVARWLKELETDGLIFSCNFNKVKFDKTKWYTINFVQYDYMILNKCMSISQIEKWVSQVEKWVSQGEKPIPTHTPTNTPNNKKEKKIKKEKSNILQTTPEGKREKSSAKKERKRFDIIECDFPKVFDQHPALKQTFLDFAEMRRQMKKPYRTRKGVETKLRALERDCKKYGIKNVIEAIEFSIGAEYQGIFVQDYTTKKQRNEKSTNNNGNTNGSIYENFARSLRDQSDPDGSTFNNYSI